MKYKTTKSAVLNGYSKTVKIGYCNLQTLLAYENPVAYTARREGWGADIYDVDGVAIITGYAPFGKFDPGRDLCKKYESKAEKIRYDYTIPYDKQRKKLRKLLERFIEEVTEN